MNHHYPTEDQLSAMGETLQRDVCLWSALLAHEYRVGATTTTTTPSGEWSTRTRKEYQSNYVGVGRRYNGYCGCWAPAPGKYVRGPVRPDERTAALDRAQALGLDYLEVRA